MAIPTDIYSLHEITSAEGDTKLVLTRVHRHGYSNASQPEEDAADSAALQEEAHLLLRYFSEFCEVSGPYEVQQIGEFQGNPVGDLSEQPPGELTLWIADTAYGPPWLILGTPESEEAFWQEISENEDLKSLKPLHPARCIPVFYLPSPKTS